MNNPERAQRVARMNSRSIIRRSWLFLLRWRRRAAGLLLILLALAFLGIMGIVSYLDRLVADDDTADYMFMLRLDSVERQRRQTEDGYVFEVDNSPATFILDLMPKAEMTHQRLFPDHAAAIVYARQAGLNILPSVGLVHDKCKKVNDQLSRVLEVAMQADLPRDELPGRRGALQLLATALQEQLEQAAADHRPAFERALVYVAGALQAGGSARPPNLPPELARQAAREVQDFLAIPVLSRPIGFWDQTQELIDIFRQDRFLGQGLCMEKETAAAIALAGTIVDNPPLRAAFERSARFGSRLTNPPPEYRFSPLSFSGLTSPQEPWSQRLSRQRLQEIRQALPPSLDTVSLALAAFAFSPEEALWLQTPLGFSGAELIRAIEQGIIDLEPKPDSGWYDYQWYALETLVLPERGSEDHKLITNLAYRDRLREIFLAAIARDRETHIKNLPIYTIGASLHESEREVPVGPQFTVEPLPTVYLRQARTYRFLKTVMSSLIERRLHETTMSDPLDKEGAEVTVARALDRMTALNYGLYELACRDLGMITEYMDEEYDQESRAAAVLLANGWLVQLEDDPDLQQDTRVAVPLFRDEANITYWACAGVRLESLATRYDEKPQVYGVEPIWASVEYWIASEVFLEFTNSGKPWTRDEFRDLCDAQPDEVSLRAFFGAPPRFASRRPKWFRFAVWSPVLALLIMLARRCPRKKRQRLVRTTLLLSLAVLISTLAFLATAHRLRTRILVEHVLHRSPFLSVAAGARYYRNASPRWERGRLHGLLESMAYGKTPQSRYLAAYLIECHYYYRSELIPTLIEPEVAIPLLRQAAKDRFPQVAAAAISILEHYDTPETVELLQRQ